MLLFFSVLNPILSIHFVQILLQIFSNESEAHPDFFGFFDFLQTFDIFRGRRSGYDFLDRGNVVGKLKVIVTYACCPTFFFFFFVIRARGICPRCTAACKAYCATLVPR
jgi:hypothetical protein